MTKDETLNLALDALKTLMIERGSIYDKAITAIKEALAQPAVTESHKQKPVGWYDSISGQMDFTFYKPHRKPSSPSAEWIPVYSRPSPPQRKPLTDEEINEFFQGMEPNNGFWLSFARAIEAAVWEKQK